MKLKVTVARNGLGFDDYSSDIFIPCSFLQLNVLLSIKDLSKFNIAWRNIQIFLESNSSLFV